MVAEDEVEGEAEKVSYHGDAERLRRDFQWHLTFWSLALEQQRTRALTPPAGGWDGQAKARLEVDLYLFAFALRQFLRAADKLVELDNEHEAALVEFKAAVPDMVLIRDVLTHYDEYEEGGGWHQPRGGERYGKRMGPFRFHPAVCRSCSGKRLWLHEERPSVGTSERARVGRNRSSAAVPRDHSRRRPAPMDIVRNADGTLVVPVQPERPHATDDDADASSGDADRSATQPTTRILHPGEGGYDEALAEWDLQQNPGRPPPVSTATGRQEAMALVHAVANSPDHAVAPAVAALTDPNASGEALRHVLVGGVPSVEAFAAEVAEAEGGDPLPAHKATKIIGEVLSELDSS